MSDIRVFVFSAGFGLPTTGPFALKLEFWLRMAGIDFERVYEDDTRKGPKGKNPWIEIDGEEMGDTELIIERLSAERGIDLDSHLDARQRAIGTTVRRMVEEHLHQVFEWELFVHDEGFELIEELLEDSMPWGVRSLAKTYMRWHFRRQLHARGIARHEPDKIAAMGRSDLDAVEEMLGDGSYLFGEKPCTTDASVFGLCAPLVYAPADAPVMNYAATLPRLSSYCERILNTWFDESDAGENPGETPTSSVA